MTTSIVLGGAGFLGSHLVEALLKSGHCVVVFDNFTSGSLGNLSHLGSGSLVIEPWDITEPIPHRSDTVDFVFNLASPASPPHYMRNRLKTLQSGSLGVINSVELACHFNARLIYASTSEVYGDPLSHPQKESDWGNVNPIGDRSCYDESKRFGEAYCVASAIERGIDVGVARIFNTYGPRLSPSDGRVVSNFVVQALTNVEITIYGDGQQTRSFCYVDDLVDGLIRLAKADIQGPVNLGNPSEISMIELASRVIALTQSKSRLTFKPLPQDDPVRRRPDISLASDELQWSPKVNIDDGLMKTILWFNSFLQLEN